jgi:hypothetical protein
VPLCMLQAGSQGFKIAVDVGKQGEFHVPAAGKIYLFIILTTSQITTPSTAMPPSIMRNWVPVMFISLTDEVPESPPARLSPAVKENSAARNVLRKFFISGSVH